MRYLDSIDASSEMEMPFESALLAIEVHSSKDFDQLAPVLSGGE